MRMVRTICSSLMQSLARIIPAIIRNTRGTATAGVVHRRIEITVERESVSLLVPGQRAEAAGGAASGKSAPETGSGIPRCKALT